MGVAVALDPQGEAGHILIGPGLPLGRLHLAVQDKADNGRDAEGNEHGNHQVSQPDVIVYVDGFAVVGVVVQRLIAHLDVGICRVLPLLIGEQRDDLVLLLLDAVIGKGGDAPAVGNGDILAGADGQQEEDAALLVAIAEAVGDVIIFA